jgi:hypothetical protein
MAYFCVDSSPAAGVPGEIHTTKQNTLGAERRFSDGTSTYTYVYLEGAASTVANDVVTYSPAGVATRILTTSTGPVAVASAAIVNATYGWFGIIGSFTGTVESSCLSNVPLYPLSAGRVDDAIVANKGIMGMVASTAGVSGATATLTLNRPWVGTSGQSA